VTPLQLSAQRHRQGLCSIRGHAKRSSVDSDAPRQDRRFWAAQISVPYPPAQLARITDLVDRWQSGAPERPAFIRARRATFIVVARKLSVGRSDVHRAGVRRIIFRDGMFCSDDV